MSALPFFSFQNAGVPERHVSSRRQVTPKYTSPLKSRPPKSLRECSFSVSCVAHFLLASPDGCPPSHQWAPLTAPTRTVHPPLSRPGRGWYFRLVHLMVPVYWTRRPSIAPSYPPRIPVSFRWALLFFTQPALPIPVFAQLFLSLKKEVIECQRPCPPPFEDESSCTTCG